MLLYPFTSDEEAGGGVSAEGSGGSEMSAKRALSMRLLVQVSLAVCYASYVQ